MKTIILYCRRNVGLCVLSYLVAKGYEVKVISDDETVLWMAEKLYCEVVTIEKMPEFDLFICCHGDKIIDKKYLVEGKFINIHPCLYKYPGKNPIGKYILNEDTDGTVESQWLIEEVDGGEVIHKEEFSTPICNSYAAFYNIALPYYLKTLEATLTKLKL